MRGVYGISKIVLVLALTDIIALASLSHALKWKLDRSHDRPAISCARIQHEGGTSHVYLLTTSFPCHCSFWLRCSGDASVQGECLKAVISFDLSLIQFKVSIKQLLELHLHHYPCQQIRHFYFLSSFFLSFSRMNWYWPQY